MRMYYPATIYPICVLSLHRLLWRNDLLQLYIILPQCRRCLYYPATIYPMCVRPTTDYCDTTVSHSNSLSNPNVLLLCTLLQHVSAVWIIPSQCAYYPTAIYYPSTTCRTSHHDVPYKDYHPPPAHTHTHNDQMSWASVVCFPYREIEPWLNQTNHLKLLFLTSYPGALLYLNRVRTGCLSVRITWLSRISDHDASCLVSQWGQHYKATVDYALPQVGTRLDITLDVARM